MAVNNGSCRMSFTAAIAIEQDGCGWNSSYEMEVLMVAKYRMAVWCEFMRMVMFG